VFARDFRQTLPVVQRGNEAQIVNECIGNAEFWPRVQKMKLKRNMRVEAATGADRSLRYLTRFLVRYVFYNK
jgi:hypothetical protein